MCPSCVKTADCGEAASTWDLISELAPHQTSVYCELCDRSVTFRTADAPLGALRAQSDVHSVCELLQPAPKSTSNLLPRLRVR